MRSGQCWLIFTISPTTAKPCVIVPGVGLTLGIVAKVAGAIYNKAVRPAYPRERSMHKFAGFLIFTLFFAPVYLYARDSNQQALFRIERNTNANIIQYDAQIGTDGKLLKKEPIVAYWVRLAEQGQVQKLSWIQRTFAYGFDTKYDRGKDSVELDMKADIGRPITVRREGDVYRATARINGAVSYIEKIFIHATGKGMSTTVDYIELHGEDAATGDMRYEKFKP